MSSLAAIQVSLNPFTLPGAIVGNVYSGFQFTTLLQVTGDSTFTSDKVTWAVTSGSLPAGLTLNSATGALTGTPTASGASNFTVQATYKTRSAQQAYSLAIEDYVDYSALMGAYTKDAIGFARQAGWSGALGNTFYWNTASGASYAGRW